MDGSFSQLGLYLLGSLVAGAGIGWLMRSAMIKHRINQLNDDWQSQLDDVARRRDRLTAETQTLRSSIEAQQGAIHRHEMAVANMRTELESAHETEKLMSKSIFTLRSEREDFKNKVSTFQNALAALKQQSAELQTEFVKSGDFYKGELAKSFEKRKALEVKSEKAKQEYESFSNLLQASRSEQDSVNKMLSSAQTRLSSLDKLEQNVIELEAENAQLKHDSARTQQENEALKRDIGDQEDLKVQNKELSHCLRSMENSRKQYETDAKRYRDHAGQSEQQSETLRIRLDEVEKNFTEMEQQQRHAIKEARKATVDQVTIDQEPEEKEVDNLQEIIGIGRVFEMTLHELGVFSFRQIAAFGVADIARINVELRECKGRMEQDDWIGQAKDLLFKKYN